MPETEPLRSEDPTASAAGHGSAASPGIAPAAAWTAADARSPTASWSPDTGRPADAGERAGRAAARGRAAPSRSAGRGGSGGRVLAAVVAAGAILWPGMSEAEDPGKRSAGGKGEAARGIGEETRNPTASGGPANGVSGTPSAGLSSPSAKNAKNTPGGPSPKPSAGRTRSKTRSAQPTTTRSSASSGGGGGRPGLVLTVIGTKRGSCYTKGGYQYEINYPNAKHQTYVDGDYIDGSSDRSSKVGPATFWGSGNHVVAIYMDDPNIVKRVSFTMC